VFQDKLKKLSEDYNSKRAEMEGWTIGRTVINVTQTGRVVAVILIATSIVCCGMAIPFVVGEKINGVDPFQPSRRVQELVRE
jgi:hypothetical protein